MSNNYVDNLSLVPRISKSQFDHAAECFLRDTCKEALERPMPVPIMEIARKKLGLRACRRRPFLGIRAYVLHVKS